LPIDSCSFFLLFAPGFYWRHTEKPTTVKVLRHHVVRPTTLLPGTRRTAYERTRLICRSLVDVSCRSCFVRPPLDAHVLGSMFVDLEPACRSYESRHEEMKPKATDGTPQNIVKTVERLARSCYAEAHRSQFMAFTRPWRSITMENHQMMRTGTPKFYSG
jgi:hypothetical protein